MNKFIGCIVSLLLLIGCSSSTQEERVGIEAEQNFSVTTYTDRSKEEVSEILNPLLEGVYLENKMIQGSTYLPGMTLENFREFMMIYYTEELANETINLILYKSKLGYGVEYSGMFYYNQDTDIFYLESSRGVENFPENAQIAVDEIMKQTEDRIEVRAHTNWKLMEDNRAIGTDGFVDDYLVTIIMEKEGNQWYLGDLVFSRTTINEANREYRKR